MAASLRRAREMARERKHGMTTCEIAAAYHTDQERVSRIVREWAALRRETSPLPRQEAHS